MEIKVKDVTPPAAIVHQLVVAPADVPAFIAQIDSTAPPGRGVAGISARIGPGGEIDLTITYKPETKTS